MSQTPRIGRCPQCSKTSRLDESNGWRPFCSERCKLVDLGAWAAGDYRLAGAPVDPLQPPDEGSSS